MFYNSKKLIDEKVLQQYFFERFMTASKSRRMTLVPPPFHQSHSSTEAIKVLRPEVQLTKGFVVDFVLYPETGGVPLNIELKWKASDFARETHRHDWFNGQLGTGFVVVLKNDLNKPIENIPIVSLGMDDFQDWFIESSPTIVAQAFFRKFGEVGTRHTRPANWLIYIGHKSYAHYTGPAMTHGIWAFKDRNPANNIMKIMTGDNLLFVRANSSNPARMFVSAGEPDPLQRTSAHNGKLYQNEEIDWSLSAIDIFSVSEGYHMDFSNEVPYNVFEEESWTTNPIPRLKTYTQFVRFNNGASSNLTVNSAPPGHQFNRAQFPHNYEPLRHFVSALRRAAGNRGDVAQLSDATFTAAKRLLSSGR